jgi:hypothetical protein
VRDEVSITEAFQITRGFKVLYGKSHLSTREINGNFPDIYKSSENRKIGFPVMQGNSGVRRTKVRK